VAEDEYRGQPRTLGAAVVRQPDCGPTLNRRAAPWLLDAIGSRVVLAITGAVMADSGRCVNAASYVVSRGKDSENNL
jgi:hypothetical protein